MSIPFHETRLGRNFYERDLPAIRDALTEIAQELRRLNERLKSASEGVPDDPAR